MPFNFQKICDKFQEFLLAYPLRITLAMGVVATLPTAINLLSGGTFWGPQINIGITNFSYDSFVIFFWCGWILKFALVLHFRQLGSHEARKEMENEIKVLRSINAYQQRELNAERSIRTLESRVKQSLKPPG